MLKVGDAEFVKARDDDVRALLPVHAYSQKQLSSVSVRLDELTRFVTAPIKTRLGEVDQQIEDHSGRVRENYATLQRFRALQRNVARAELNERSLADQVRNLRASLGGLSEQDRVILNNKPAYDDLKSVTGTWTRQVEEVKASTRDLLHIIDTPMAPLSATPPEPEAVRHLVQEFATASKARLQDLHSQLRAALKSLEEQTSSESTWALRQRALLNAIEQFDQSYAAVRDRSTAHEAKLQELGELEERQTTTRELVKRQRRELQSMGNPQDLHTRLRSELVGLMNERSALIARQCVELTTLSGGLLRASLQRGKELTKVEERFRVAISGSGVRASRIEIMFQTLAQESDPIATWEAVLSELERLTLVEPGTEITSEMTPTLTRLGFQLADQRRITSKLTPEAWLDLALTRIDDTPAFEYQSKEGEYIQFSLASAG